MSKNERTLTDALRTIAKALKEPAGGEYWPARKFLDRYGVFHDDLSGTRVLNLVAVTALEAVQSEQRKARRKKRAAEKKRQEWPAPENG